ncbi:unnamed protein product [Trichobilharzia szidati]|nr:unnamed protein product [Trichobilharzia szidati]
MNPNYEDLSAWNLNDANNPMSNTNSYYPGGPGFPGGGPGYPGGGPGYPGGGPCYPAGGPGFPGGGGQGFPPPAPCQGAPLGYPGPDPAGFPPSGSMGFGNGPQYGYNPSGAGYPAQGYPQTDSNYGGARQYIPGAPICPSQPSCGTMDSFSYNDSDYGRGTDRNPYSEPNRSCQSNSYKDIFNPTVKDAPNFDAEADCERLRKAMAGLGTNEKELIDVMAHRSPAQRVAITKKYKALFGKDLTSKFRSELSGHFLDCMIALCLSPAEFDASELYKAMKGLGTDEDVLIEILCSRTNEQIREIKEAYSKMHRGRDLEKDIRDDTSGYFKRVCVALVQGDRDENPQVDESRARRDAEELYNAGERRLGTDESKFIQVLCSRSYPHLRAVFGHYTTLGRRDMEKAISSEMSGDLCKAMLSTVRCIQNKPKYFAKKLRDSMRGAGTRDTTLIRIVVSRSAIDMGAIKTEFQSLTGKTLGSWIADDTSGDYRRLLLALVGA